MPQIWKERDKKLSFLACYHTIFWTFNVTVLNIAIFGLVSNIAMSTNLRYRTVLVKHTSSPLLHYPLSLSVCTLIDTALWHFWLLFSIFKSFKVFSWAHRLGKKLLPTSVFTLGPPCTSVCACVRARMSERWSQRSNLCFTVRTIVNLRPLLPKSKKKRKKKGSWQKVARSTPRKNFHCYAYEKTRYAKFIRARRGLFHMRIRIEYANKGWICE